MQLPATKTQYCWVCHEPGAERQGSAKASYLCATCGASSERVLIFDPNMRHYFDEQDRLVHESCGVFIVRGDGKLLMFQRTKFPFLLTIPAGHLEVGENPITCAAREMEEEVGIKSDTLTEVFAGVIENEPCVGGADIHRWHAYGCKVEGSAQVKLDSEGESWGWYDLVSLNADNTVSPVLFMLGQQKAVQALMTIAVH